MHLAQRYIPLAYYQEVPRSLSPRTGIRGFRQAQPDLLKGI